VIGAPFYLMERRRGVVVRQTIPPEIGEDLELRRRISESLVDTLADLHAVDIQSTGLVSSANRQASSGARLKVGPGGGSARRRLSERNE